MSVESALQKNPTKQIGLVKWFNNKSGYGFITKARISFHITRRSLLAEIYTNTLFRASMLSLISRRWNQTSTTLTRRLILQVLWAVS